MLVQKIFYRQKDSNNICIPLIISCLQYLNIEKEHFLLKNVTTMNISYLRHIFY